jgi:hypothetical protein
VSKAIKECDALKSAREGKEQCESEIFNVKMKIEREKKEIA